MNLHKENTGIANRLPLFSIVLAGLLLCSFAVTQFVDSKQRALALKHYETSGLLSTEREAYAQYGGSGVTAGSSAESVWQAMRVDTRFQQALNSNSAIKPSDVAYPEWKESRRRFEQLMRGVPSEQFGFKTAQPSPIQALTHPFVHTHWLVFFTNILVLLTLACILEKRVGRLLFATVLFSTAVVAAWLASVIGPITFLPFGGIGAGLIGLSAFLGVLGGRRAPETSWGTQLSLPSFAIALVAAAVIFLAGRLASGGQLSIVAALSAAIIGGAAGFLARGKIEIADEAEAPEAELPPEQAAASYKEQYELAESYCNEGKFADALPILLKLEKQNPRDHKVCYRLQRCTRRDSNSEEYHEYSLRVMRFQARREDVHAMVRDTFQHYIQNARPSRLNKATIVSLAERFIREGDLNEAEYLIQVLLKKPPISDEVQLLIEKLANLLYADGQEKKSRIYRRGLQKVLSSGEAADTLMLDSRRA